MTRAQGGKMNGDRRKSTRGLCGAAHPLLEDATCSRLKGHPGKHGAYVDSPSVEATVEWEEEG